jgi:ABC-2 type transport system permease protein
VTFRPGSTAWLMRHEFRLYWRGISKAVGSKIPVLLLLILLHLIAIPMALALKHTPPLSSHAAALGLTIGGAFILFLMISRSLITAVQALYARGDMDLLLSSPLSPRAIIAVRASVIAASATMEFGLLIWPFANVFVLFGLLGWLRAYVLLPALGMLATSISLVLALMLFHAFGARRTRVIAQIASALIAAGFMILLQLPNIMRSRGRNAAAATGALTAGLPGDSAFLTPALAVLGGSVSTLAIAVACAAIFGLTLRLLGGAFIRASTAAASISVGRRTRNPRDALRFHGNTRLILILKELRLIARDPWLLTQLLQQSIFLLPLGAVLWRQRGAGLPLAWGAVILLASFLASALAWITVSAEDVPELVAAAPIPAGQIRRVKLQAALLPILPVIWLPVLVLWRSHLWFGFSVSLCALGSAVSCALLNVHSGSPGKRSDFRLRNKGNAGQGFIELLLAGGWMLVCTAMVWLSPWR